MYLKCLILINCNLNFLLKGPNENSEMTQKTSDLVESNIKVGNRIMEYTINLLFHPQSP